MEEIHTLPPIGTLHHVFAQGRVQPATITLFKEWTRLTTDDHGEMQGAPLQGFYAANTQFMTHYDIRVNGEPVSHRLSAQLSANEWSTTGAVLRSGDYGNLPKGTLPTGSIEVRILRKVDQGWSERIFVKNNGVPARRIHLEIRMSCPIRDNQFEEEMKTESKLAWRGLVPKASRSEHALRFHFERRFGKRKRAPTEELRSMYGDQAPRIGAEVVRALDVDIRLAKGKGATRIRARPGKITVIKVDTELQARGDLCLELRYSPTIDEDRLPAPDLQALDPLPRAKASIPDFAPRMRSSNSTLNLVIGQAMTDLRALRLPIFGSSPLEKNRYIAFNAGIPRYIGLFGRDNLVIAWQSPIFGLDLFEPALSHLELLQGLRRDDWRDEEPNRFPHERRLNPRSELGQINRELYYGDVTSTPFWVLALSTLYQWSGDPELLARHRETIQRCCDWILLRLRQGNGFIYYAPAIPGRSDENRHQAWKDSGDAIVDAEGRIVVPPLAVAEIQGYAYQALIEASEIFRILDADGSSVGRPSYLKEAEELRARFNQRFWLEDENFYAVALDFKGRPVGSIASNIGHCFTTGILEDGRIWPLIGRLMDEEMFSGWGIRTLSSKNPGYDPFSYHRGAVWPVENAFIANGMAALGFHRESLRLASAQLGVAAIFQHMRLPEVLSGHPRTSESPTPGVYNFGNLFQSWSVSAIAQHLQSMLGVRPRADQGALYLDPHLPDWLEWIELTNLRVGNQSIDLRFWRDSDGNSRVEPLRPVQGLRILSGMPEPFGREARRLDVDSPELRKRRA